MAASCSMSDIRALAVPMLRLTGAAFLAVALTFGATGGAIADICRSIEAELVAISRGPSPRERQTATRAALEAQRLRAHMTAIGCDRQPFLFLGPQPPAECRAYRAQAAGLQAQAQAAYPPDEGRRRHLMAQLATHGCGAPAQRRSLPLTAGTFDDGVRRPGELSSMEIDPQPEREPAPARAPAGKPVCVRLCDGYFFPLHLRGNGLAEEGDTQCQSLCPGAETKIYFTQGGIESAVSAKGEPYAELDTALHYRKRYNASCSCRRADYPAGPGPELLNPEGAADGGFGVINPDPEYDAPLRGMTPVPGRRNDGPLFKREPRPTPSPPPEVEMENVVPGDQGEVRSMKGRDGVTRNVRVIGPARAPAPGAAGEGATQGRAQAP